MGNARKFGRTIRKINGHSHDMRPGAAQVVDFDCPDAGAYNAYRCPVCEMYTVVVHADKGVTPMFLACRATENCEGMGVSIGYPKGKIPDKLKAACRFEWYRPDHQEWLGYEPSIREHVSRGGLLLRRR